MTNKKVTNQEETATTNLKKCFVMMPIADHPDYDLGHFNRVYQYLIKPACAKAGYQAIRADDNKASNMIMFDILKKIVECDMAICDLSSRNANVFYELGLRQAFNKKTILITDNLLPTPFDISAFRYVSYSSSLRVDTVDREIPSIVSMLRETENQPADDVNSIIKLLQIQPSKVENIDLSKEESVIYEMLINLQKQVAEINFPKVSSSRKEFRIVKGHKTSVNDTSVYSGLSFSTLKEIYPEKLLTVHFQYNDNYIGLLDSIDDNIIRFTAGDDYTEFPNNEKITSDIFVI